MPFKRFFFICIFSCLSGGLYSQLPDKNTIASNVPILFRENVGQWDDQVLFKGQSPGWDASVSFLKDGLSFGFVSESHSGINDKAQYKALVWNTRFLGANPAVKVESKGESNSHTNYLLGSDFTKHKTDVPDFTSILYKDIYPGIDFDFYGAAKGLKYDYIVKPGAHPEQIMISCEGIKKLEINKVGQLEIETEWGVLIEDLPESFQWKNGKKIQVEVQYKLIDSKTFTFSLSANYDKSIELVIDPVGLEWSTYCGGTTLATTGYVYDIAVDASENCYLTGHYLTDLPIIAGSYDTSWNGPGMDAYVMKLNSTGTNLIYCTYIGGTNGDEFGGHGIAVNAAGEAVMVGGTSSSNFPTTAGVYDQVFGAYEGFVIKLDAAGSSLIFSTFLGASADAISVALNAADEVFIMGLTGSAVFPTTAGVFQPAFAGGNNDYFVSKLNSTGSALLLSTYVGGNGQDATAATSYTSTEKLILNASDEVYVCGLTNSANFPITAGAYDNTFSGTSDAVIFKLNSTFTNLLFSTFLGGTGDESANSMDLDATGNIYLSGFTSSANFPVLSGFQMTYGGGTSDAFITKLNPNASSIIFSTFLGGNNLDVGHGINVNSYDEPVVVGYTGSSNFPTTTCAFDRTYAGANPGPGVEDMFLAKVNASGNTLVIGSFIGGGDADYSRAKVLFVGQPCDEKLIMTITTHSTNYPTTTGVYQPAKFNTATGFGGSTKDQPAVTKFYSTLNPGFLSSRCGLEVVFTDTTKDCGLFAPITTWAWDFGDGQVSSVENPIHTYTTSGTYTVTLTVGCPMASVQKIITVNSTILTTTTSSTSASCNSSDGSASVIATGTGPYTYTWMPIGQTGSTAINLSGGTYYVTTTDEGCIVIDTVVVLKNVSFNTTTSSLSATCVSADGSASVVVSGIGSYTYLWSAGGQTGATATNLAAGNYYVTTTEASCSVVDTVVVLQVPTFTITASSSAASCGIADGSASVSPTTVDVYTYLWSSGATGQTTINVLAGSYSVTITNAGGCNLVTSVIVASNSTLSLASIVTPGCEVLGGEVSAAVTGGSSPLSYVWLPGGATGSTVSGLPNGSYSLTVQDLSGCTITTVVTLINYSTPVASAGADATITSGGSVTLNGSGGTTYLWSPSGTLSCTACSSPIAAPNTNTNYTVVVTDGNGCDAQDEVMVFVEIKCGEADFIFIPTAFSPNGDGVNDYLFLRGSVCLKEILFVVYNRWGEKVFETSSLSDKWDGKFRNQNADSGVFVYSINATSVTGEKVEKKGNVTLLR